MPAKVNHVVIITFNSFRYVVGVYETYQEAADAGFASLVRAQANWKRNKGAKPKLLICSVVSRISLL